MLVLGFVPNCGLIPTVSSRVDRAFNQAGGFPYEHSQRKNTLA
jgi:hypothetical protein